MEKFKDFQGKDLDECITQACAYFDLPREKLEIEIIQDAKSGIFGIVLARKAKIRAKKAELPEAERAIFNITENRSIPKKKAEPAQTYEKDTSEASQEERRTFSRSNNSYKKGQYKGHWQKKPDFKQPSREGRGTEENVETGAKLSKPEVKEVTADKLENVELFVAEETFNDDIDDFAENDANVIKNLDSEKLANQAREIVNRLLEPIAGHEVDVNIDIAYSSIYAKVKWQGDVGLLIGREGQTLNALQYLASRMISHVMDAPLRIHLDIGEYRARQDDKLREIGKALAEKARQTGRSYATRPLSSYQRRVIHLCLQNEPGVETKSAGDGVLKRVLIFPRNR